jgi:hypothetical protein
MCLPFVDRGDNWDWNTKRKMKQNEAKEKESKLPEMFQSYSELPLHTLPQKWKMGHSVNERNAKLTDIIFYDFP